MLKIKNLKANVDGKAILKGLNLNVNAGEVHAIMGPNGSGKSSLSKVIAGYPGYEVTDGEVLYEINFQDKNLLEMEPEERAREGVFMAFQYPVEIPGVSNIKFLQTAFNEICKPQGIAPMDDEKFRQFQRENAKLVHMSEGFFRPLCKLGLFRWRKKEKRNFADGCS